MKITINVTDKHIAAGYTSSPESCPIARALRSAGFKDVAVCASSITLYNKKNALNRGTYEFVNRESVQITKVPKKVATFVNAFDDGETPVKPFTFTVNLSLSDLKKLNFKPRLAA